VSTLSPGNHPIIPLRQPVKSGMPCLADPEKRGTPNQTRGQTLHPARLDRPETT